MTYGLVHASYSLPKLTFFAPVVLMINQEIHVASFCDC